MSKTPLALLVPSPTFLPWSSTTVNRTSGTGLGGFSRRSVRQPWMWMVSSLRGAGFWQADSPTCETGAAYAEAAPVITRTAATRATSRAEMVLGRAGMVLLSQWCHRSVSGVTRDYSDSVIPRCKRVRRSRPSPVEVTIGQNPPDAAAIVRKLLAAIYRASGSPDARGSAQCGD